MKKLILLCLTCFSISAQAEIVAFLCTYGKSGEVISAEEVQVGQKTLSKTYYWSDDLTVKVTILDLTKKNSTGIVKEIANGKEKELPAECFLTRN